MTEDPSVPTKDHQSPEWHRVLEMKHPDARSREYPPALNSDFSSQFVRRERDACLSEEKLENWILDERRFCLVEDPGPAIRLLSSPK